jgi:hypothetical protein
MVKKMNGTKDQKEIINCPGLVVGEPIPQCRYLMNLRDRGALPPTVSTDCNPGVDNPNCPNNIVYLVRQ